MVFTNVFSQLVAGAEKTARYVSSCGGTRSGKTFSALQFLLLLVSSDKSATVNTVVSETFPHLKRGAIRDFETIIGHPLKDDPAWSITESTYTFPHNGAKIEFFSVDNSAKVHGPARDRLFVNEAQNVEYETARQLFVRTRDLILLDYNPTHAFWLNEKIEPLPECVTIHSTYRDNYDRATGESMLSAAQIREIESNRTDENWWRIYGEGLTGRLEGLIYPDFEQIDSMPEDPELVDLYGLDFGYTNDPSTLIRVKVDTRRRVIYADQLLYERGLLNSEIVDRLRAQGVPRSAEIYADSAEPKSVDEIAAAGFNCKGCFKGKTVVEQIQFIKGFSLKITKRSVDMIRELRNYSWLKGKNGEFLNEPNKGQHYDHALDALRYAVFSRLGQFKKPLRGGKPKTARAW